MTRVSTLAQQQVVINQMLRAQTQVADVQRQVATGYKTDRFEGIARDTSALVSARALESRTQKFIELGRQVGAQVGLQEASLSTLYDAAKTLRDNLLHGLANDSGRTLEVDLDSALISGKAVLNTRFAGKYLFGGSRTDTQPFTAVDLADLAILATPITDFFQNSQQKAQVRLEQNLIVEHGVLADEMGLEMMASVKRLAEYNAATPFSQVLTPADRTILQTEITNLDNVLLGIIKLQANNGFVANRIEAVTIRNEALETVNTQLIADISEVDMAEAISRLNQDKVAVEASYNLIRQFAQLSLLNFL